MLGRRRCKCWRRTASRWWYRSSAVVGCLVLILGIPRRFNRLLEANVASLYPLVADGYDVVVPTASCSLMLKREYPELSRDEKTKRVAERTFDVCEYLMAMKKTGHLATDFMQKPGRVAYQIPCHLRDQNIGFKSRELMECAGAQVEVIEQCSGHDGAWSAKTEFFQLSMKIAGKGHASDRAAHQRTSSRRTVPWPGCSWIRPARRLM